MGQSVSVVDVHAALEIDRIILENNAYSLDLSPKGDTAYVSNFPFGRLTVIKIPENSVIDVINLNLPPFSASGSAGVAVTPDGRYVYVANYISHNISVVSTLEKRVVTLILLKAGPSQLAITPDGNLAYVTLADTKEVAVVDLNSNAAVKYIEVGTDPEGISLSPTRLLALVANQYTDNLSTINTQIAESSDTTFPAAMYQRKWFFILKDVLHM